MTQRQLAAYVRDCADAMGLRDWKLEVTVGEPVQDASGHLRGATCEPVPGRRLAEITVAPWYLNDTTPEELRHTVAHELVHCHWSACWDQVRLDLVSPMGQAQYDTFIASYERSMEYAVDALALAIAPRLPLATKEPSHGTQ